MLILPYVCIVRARKAISIQINPRVMNPELKQEFLRQFPLFEDLTDRELLLLAHQMEHRKRARYQYIYAPGETSSTVFFLLKGVIKIGTHSGEGREVIKSILHPMAMFGELGIVGEKTRKDFAKVMNKDVEMLALDVARFHQFIANNHGLSMKILSMLGNRLRRAENRLEALVFKDARTRIIEFLKDSVAQRGYRVGYEMLLKHSLTQQDIANLTGTSRQTVTSVLNDLRKANLIYFNRKSILIRDMARLA